MKLTSYLQELPLYFPALVVFTEIESAIVEWLVLRFLVWLFFLSAPALAEAPTYSDRFCVVEIATPTRPGGRHPQGISNILVPTEKENTLFFLGDHLAANPNLLRGDRFIRADVGISRRIAPYQVIITPDGELLGTGRANKDLSIYKQDPDTGLIVGTPMGHDLRLAYKRAPVWSTPLNAMLFTLTPDQPEISKENTLYKYDDSQVKLVDGVRGHVQTIVDFPELQLTFLGTAKRDRIYIIDATGKVHYLGPLDLGEWVFFRTVHLLDNPKRLLVVATEAMGSFRGRYLIQLKENNGIWQPVEQPYYSNIIFGLSRLRRYDNASRIGYYLPDSKRYFIFGRKRAYFWERLKLREVGRYGLKVADVDEVSKLPDAPITLKTSIYRFKHNGRRPEDDPLKRKNEIKMVASNSVLFMNDEEFYIRDEHGISHVLNTENIDIQSWIWKHAAAYLEHRGEVITAEKNGYFLIKDRHVSGEAACH